MSDFKQYLGDSVYVEWDPHKCMVKLTTNNGYADDPRNVIYLDIRTLEAFDLWVKKFFKTLEEKGR